MTPHLHHPQTASELAELVKNELESKGFDCRLNHIDVSGVQSMRNLFSYSDFVGDISEWDVRNVVDANSMFYGARFNGDISKWRFSPNADMQDMFTSSAFRGDLSEWTFPAYLAKSNPAPMFGWSDGIRHRAGPWESLQIPVWPVTFRVLFGYDELTSRDASNEWLAARPLCRYHWDVLLHEHGRPYQSDATWHQPEQMEHLKALLPTLQGLGLSPIEMAEQLQATWQMKRQEPVLLALPTLD